MGSRKVGGERSGQLEDAENGVQHERRGERLNEVLGWEWKSKRMVSGDGVRGMLETISEEVGCIGGAAELVVLALRCSRLQTMRRVSACMDECMDGWLSATCGWMIGAIEWMVGISVAMTRELHPLLTANAVTCRANMTGVALPRMVSV